MSDVCSLCKAPIVWAITRNNRRMPIDAEPVDEGANIALIPRADGTLHARVGGSPARPATHVSHFATCPYADGFRRRA